MTGRHVIRLHRGRRAAPPSDSLQPLRHVMKTAFARPAALALLTLLVQPALPTPAADGAAELGERVEAVRRAIACPRCEGSMRAVVALGTDSRYYVMTRGWLAERLRADQSVLDATRGPAPPELLDRVEFLRRAIRRIDLE